MDERDSWSVVAVSGEVDIRTAPELREQLVSVIDGGSHRLIVDLTAVEFLDSTALSVMVGAHKRLVRLGSRLVIVATDERTLRVLNVTGLSRVFSVHDSLESALTL